MLLPSFEFGSTKQQYTTLADVPAESQSRIEKSVNESVRWGGDESLRPDH
jgi:hypothetical protein